MENRDAIQNRINPPVVIIQTRDGVIQGIRTNDSTLRCEVIDLDALARETDMVMRNLICDIKDQYSTLPFTIY